MQARLNTPATPALLAAAATTAPESNVRAALELVTEYNHGEIVRRPTWLETFTYVAGDNAYVIWERLDTALNNPQAPEEWRDAAAPYSDTERSMMRLACDLALGTRWGIGWWDDTTRGYAIRAFTKALNG